ncbi:VOC family protein [uncultured Chitinophaga sp.]|uniref:VOC family protein n=1 Tax=uncultured Chitinophaga sp. TaxID=339340 RepID=UPI0025E3400E|nr:VOC family protein [uncultured Chitinophaga sp.]
MQKITPFLTLAGRATEAANFYTGIFKDGKITSTMPGPNNTVMAYTIEIEGQPFYILNMGVNEKPTPAISFFINCKNQEELDHYWNSLTDGGSPIQCGWLTDKFGVAWQVVPDILMKYMVDKNPVKAGNVAQAMMKMVKLDFKGIQDAYDKE